MVHSFQSHFVRGLDCLKAFQSLCHHSSPPKLNKSHTFFSQLPACVTVIVSRMLAERPICQPHPGMGKQRGKDACWVGLAGRGHGGRGAGALAPPALQRSRRAGHFSSPGTRRGGWDLPRWLLPSGGTAWGQWV